MAAVAIGLAAALAAVQAKAWILTCDMHREGGPPARTFRIAPQVFQELDPDTKRWGPDLCKSFPCVVRRGVMEGEISSPTVVLTIRFDPKTRAASWRTMGATAMKRSSGSCSVRPDTPAA
jgi:hypothetical protein